MDFNLPSSSSLQKPVMELPFWCSFFMNLNSAGVALPAKHKTESLWHNLRLLYRTVGGTVTKHVTLRASKVMLNFICGKTQHNFLLSVSSPWTLWMSHKKRVNINNNKKNGIGLWAFHFGEGVKVTKVWESWVWWQPVYWEHIAVASELPEAMPAVHIREATTIAYPRTYFHLQDRLCLRAVWFWR